MSERAQVVKPSLLECLRRLRHKVIVPTGPVHYARVRLAAHVPAELEPDGRSQQDESEPRSRPVWDRVRAMSAYAPYLI